jgi:hypothetical protein
VVRKVEKKFESTSSATESSSFRICHLLASNSPHLAGKPRFFEQAETTFPATFPHLLLNSPDPTVAAPFLIEVGPRVRGVACLAKGSCKLEVRLGVSLRADALSKNKAALLEDSGRAEPTDAITAKGAVKVHSYWNTSV